MNLSRSAISISLANGVGAALMIGFAPMYVELLGVSGRGDFSVALVLVSVLSAAISLGSGPTTRILAQENVLPQNLWQVVFWISILGLSCLTLITLFFSNHILTFFTTFSLRPLLILLVVAIFSSLLSVLQAALLGQSKFLKVAVLSLFFPTSQGIAVIIFEIVGSLSFLELACLTTLGFTASAVFLAAFWIFSSSSSTSSRRRVSLVDFFTRFAGSFSSFLYGRVDLVVSSAFLGSYASGLYSVAVIVFFPFYFFHQHVSAVYLKFFLASSSLMTNEERSTRYWSEIFSVCAVLAGLVAPLSLIAVPALFGSEFNQLAFTIVALCFAGAFGSVALIATDLLASTKSGRYSGLVTGSFVVIFLVSFILITPDSILDVAVRTLLWSLLHLGTNLTLLGVKIRSLRLSVSALSLGARRLLTSH